MATRGPLALLAGAHALEPTAEEEYGDENADEVPARQRRLDDVPRPR